jgi:enoyl-CoA hydratase
MRTGAVTKVHDELILVRWDEREEGGRVAHVIVNNADKHNALPVAGRALLAQRMAEISAEPDLRCVVLTGAGDRAFIGGANIGEMSQFADHRVAEDGSATTHKACDSVRRVPVPVIARISGYCLGAGMEIASSCDMRMPEVRYGLPSGMEACLIPTLVGWGKAREWVYTGDFIAAEEAYQFGFVEKLVTPGDLDAQVEKWVHSICISGPNAIRIQKQLIRDWEQMSVADAIQAGIRAVGRAHASPEPRKMTLEWRARQEAKKVGRQEQ